MLIYIICFLCLDITGCEVDHIYDQNDSSATIEYETKYKYKEGLLKRNKALLMNCHKKQMTLNFSLSLLQSFCHFVEITILMIDIYRVNTNIDVGNFHSLPNIKNFVIPIFISRGIFTQCRKDYFTDFIKNISIQKSIITIYFILRLIHLIWKISKIIIIFRIKNLNRYKKLKWLFNLNHKNHSIISIIFKEVVHFGCMSFIYHSIGNAFDTLCSEYQMLQMRSQNNNFSEIAANKIKKLIKSTTNTFVAKESYIITTLQNKELKNFMIHVLNYQMKRKNNFIPLGWKLLKTLQCSISGVNSTIIIYYKYFRKYPFIPPTINQDIVVKNNKHKEVKTPITLKQKSIIFGIKISGILCVIVAIFAGIAFLPKIMEELLSLYNKYNFRPYIDLVKYDSSIINIPKDKVIKQIKENFNKNPERIVALLYNTLLLKEKNQEEIDKDKCNELTQRLTQKISKILEQFTKDHTNIHDFTYNVQECKVLDITNNAMKTNVIINYADSIIKDIGELTRKYISKNLKKEPRYQVQSTSQKNISQNEDNIEIFIENFDDNGNENSEQNKREEEIFKKVTNTGKPFSLMKNIMYNATECMKILSLDIDSSKDSIQKINKQYAERTNAILNTFAKDHQVVKIVIPAMSILAMTQKNSVDAKRDFLKLIKNQIGKFKKDNNVIFCFDIEIPLDGNFFVRNPLMSEMINKIDMLNIGGFNPGMPQDTLESLFEEILKDIDMSESLIKIIATYHYKEYKKIPQLNKWLYLFSALLQLIMWIQFTIHTVQDVLDKHNINIKKVSDLLQDIFDSFVKDMPVYILESFDILKSKYQYMEDFRLQLLDLINKIMIDDDSNNNELLLHLFHILYCWSSMINCVSRYRTMNEARILELGWQISERVVGEITILKNYIPDMAKELALFSNNYLQFLNKCYEYVNFTPQSEQEKEPIFSKKKKKKEIITSLELPKAEEFLPTIPEKYQNEKFQLLTTMELFIITTEENINIIEKFLEEKKKMENKYSLTEIIEGYKQEKEEEQLIKDSEKPKEQPGFFTNFWNKAKKVIHEVAEGIDMIVKQPLIIEAIKYDYDNNQKMNPLSQYNKNIVRCLSREGGIFSDYPNIENYLGINRTTVIDINDEENNQEET